MQNKGFRWIEAFVVTLLGVIAVCFGVQIALADPVWGDVILGFAPTTDILTNPRMLYLALGIIGATVMPHNLYLHSGIALTFALSINAAILILAAATFHTSGRTDVEDLGRAHELLNPLLGSSIAPTMFGIALLACGLNSTVTATMAGQIVMEGFLDIRLPAWMRRLATRSVAILPAIAVTLLYGEEQTAKLLILSQVVLSLQPPFAIVPLVMFTASRAKMGALVSPRWLTFACAVIAVVIIALNLKLLYDFAYV